MKVLQVINSLGTGGAEKLLLETIPLYREKGVQMDVLVLWDNDFPFMQSLKDLECCNVYLLKKSKNYKDIYNPLHILKIRKYIKDYDIIHVHLFPAQYFVPIANIGLNKKLIFTEHNTINRRLNINSLKIIENIIYARYNVIVCISEAVSEVLKTANVLINSALVIENGVNLECVRNIPASNRILYQVNKFEKIIVMVAGFRHQKDQDTVIRCLAYLSADFRLILVGDGDRKNHLIQLAYSIGVSHKVSFLGVRNDAISILKMSDIAVLSSHWEGFGLAAVEAMASSVPLIASDVPGLREIVGGAGLLFEKGNPEDLAEKIMSVVSDDGYSSEIVARSIERAKQYDINHMVDKHIALYNKVYEGD